MTFKFLGYGTCLDTNSQGKNGHSWNLEKFSPGDCRTRCLLDFMPLGCSGYEFNYLKEECIGHRINISGIKPDQNVECFKSILSIRQGSHFHLASRCAFFSLPDIFF